MKTKEELLELLEDKQYQLNGLIRLCIELGNNDYQNNVLVKDMFNQVQEIKKQLKEVE